MIIAIIGQNSITLKNQEKQIKEWIKKQIKNINPSFVYCGMDRGTQQFAGKIVKNMKFPLICCFPTPKNNFHSFEKELMDGNASVFVSLDYSKKVEENRNYYMIDNADIILFILDNKSTSSILKKAIKYAKKQRKKIIEYKEG